MSEESPITLAVARSLDDLVDERGIRTIFRTGATGLGHHWELRSPMGALLARTARVHNGGKVAQKFWKFLSLTALDAGNDIHVELRGAQGRVLARASSINDKPGIVTVTDSAGKQMARSNREKDTFTVYDDLDQLVATLLCTEDGPWMLRDSAGSTLGNLIPGEPGLRTTPSLALWVWDAQLALNSAAYARGQHLGLRRVTQYTLIPTISKPTVALTLLPLLAGLTY